MFEVPATQIVRPLGFRTPTSIGGLKEGVYKRAMKLMGRGYSFEVETLSTGLVALTITHGGSDIATELSSNGPEVPVAFGRLVDRLCIKLQKRKRKKKKERGGEGK